MFDNFLKSNFIKFSHIHEIVNNNRQIFVHFSIKKLFYIYFKNVYFQYFEPLKKSIFMMLFDYHLIVSPPLLLALMSLFITPYEYATNFHFFRDSHFQCSIADKYYHVGKTKRTYRDCVSSHLYRSWSFAFSQEGSNKISITI